MKRPRDIFMDKAHIASRYHYVVKNKKITYENNVLVNAGIRINGHFGNVVSIDLQFTNSSLFGSFNNTENVGHMIKAVVEVLNKTDDHRCLSDLKGTPVRVVRLGRTAIGFGHFMEDQFLLVDDLAAYNGKDDVKAGK